MQIGFFFHMVLGVKYVYKIISVLCIMLELRKCPITEAALLLYVTCRKKGKNITQNGQVNTQWWHD